MLQSAGSDCAVGGIAGRFVRRKVLRGGGPARVNRSRITDENDKSKISESKRAGQLNINLKTAGWH